MKKAEKKEPTIRDLQGDIHDVLRATDSLATSVHGLHERLECVDEKVTSIDRRLIGVEKRLIVVEKTMVTKDYLDEKLADLRGELVQLARKGDRKLMTLAGELYDEGVLPEKSLKDLYEMEPFPVVSIKK